MYRFVARENIKRFKELLSNCTDEQQRETLQRLLAAEEAKLRELSDGRTARFKQQSLEIEESQTELRKSIAETERLVNNSDEMLARHHREREEDDNQGEAAHR